jgi:hypothetical protein
MTYTANPQPASAMSISRSPTSTAPSVLPRRHGLRSAQRYGTQAAFLSAGGYHHHIGLNTWQSRGGPPPAPGTTGLFHVAFLYPDRPGARPHTRLRSSPQASRSRARPTTACPRRSTSATRMATVSRSTATGPKTTGRATARGRARHGQRSHRPPGASGRSVIGLCADAHVSARSFIGLLQLQAI